MIHFSDIMHFEDLKQNIQCEVCKSNSPCRIVRILFELTGKKVLKGARALLTYQRGTTDTLTLVRIKLVAITCTFCLNRHRD